MEVVNNNEAVEPKEEKKLSYEELENVAHQLSDQSRQLAARLQQAEAFIASINKMDYEFQVLKYADKFNPEFVVTCIEDIEKVLTQKPSQEEEK